MRKTLLLAAAMFAGTVLGQSAQAQINVTSWTWNPTVINAGDLMYNGSAIGANIGAGRFELTGTQNGGPVDLFTYCVDIFQPIHPGVFTQQPIALVLPNAVKQAQLLTLLEHSDSLLAAEANVSNQRVIAAATQLAVWEIIYESNGYDANGGKVYTHSPNPAAVPLANPARTLANSYLANITNMTWVANATKSLVLLYSRNNQSQVMLGSAVPEPGTWAMMIAGIGMIGGVMRRKRRAEATATA